VHSIALSGRSLLAAGLVLSAYGPSLAEVRDRGRAVPVPMAAGASETDAGTGDDTTIRTSDIPPDAPKFEDYPVTPYRGPTAKPRMAGDRDAALFRTRIREASRNAPNFAGHYILAEWGCGSACVQIAIIDAKTGRVLHPSGLGYYTVTDVQGDLIDKSSQFRLDSALLIIIGMPNEDPALRGVSYFVMRDDRLVRIRFVRKG
jgi:hypothetical protein